MRPERVFFDGVRLLVDLFLHIVTIDTFIARVVLQTGFNIRALHFGAGFVKESHGTAGDFRNIALFEEDKAAGNRQQRQLIGGNEVFPIPRPITSGLPERAASSVPGSRESMITVP